MRIQAPLSISICKKLKAGQEVFLSGTIYTARDQAHLRICELLRRKKQLPFGLKGQVIYYCGPTSTPSGKVIGSCGPTTSRRMDAFTPALLNAGLAGMIGKGSRSPEVTAAIKRCGAVYFQAYPGCGALIAGYVRAKRLVAFAQLGPEAVYALTVKDLPLTVAIDSRGRSVFAKERL